MMKMEILFIRV